MKVLNGTEYPFDAGGNLAPWLFYGSGAPSLERQFKDAPVLSEYWDVTNSVKYVKLQNNKVVIDWQPVVIAGAITTGYLTISGTLEVSGDTTIGGTLTAGDIVSEA